VSMWKSSKGAPGKGDSPRRYDKSLWDKNFDGINWKSRIKHGTVKSVKKSVNLE